MQMQRDRYRQIVDKVQRRLNWEVERPDLMSHIIRNNDEKGMTLGEIQATFMVVTTAGSETTATTLSGTLNYLTTHLEILATLVKEVRGRFLEPNEMTLASLRDLPYLNAVISEGLRLCPPVPIMLPRLVTEGGDTVCGEWMPGGVSHPLSPIAHASTLLTANSRQASLFSLGPFSAIQHASMIPSPSALSAGCLKPWKGTPLLRAISDIPCNRLARGREHAWAGIWRGQRCV